MKRLVDFSAILPLGLFALSVDCKPFGTLNGKNNQHAEHERITRAALHCNGGSSDGTCFEPLTLDELAGKRGAVGAVGAPDLNDFFTSEAHFDDADYSDTPGYPQSRDQATEVLSRSIEYLQGHVNTALTDADGMFNEDGLLISAESDIPPACAFVGKSDDPKSTGSAKCSVLAGFGAALHGFQDFYAHSNWGDSELTSDALNPPGLRQDEPAQFLDVSNFRGLSSDDIPKDLTTGCYGFFGAFCSHRITHATLNKDAGIIDPISGDTSSPSTPRGQYDDNFNSAVQLAIKETRRQWASFSEQLIRIYGQEKGDAMICAITHDDPTNTCPNAENAVPPQPVPADPMWVFIVNGKGRTYNEGPSKLFNQNPKNLHSDGADRVEVNTNCINVDESLNSGLSGVVGNYLQKGDDFYFGWDPDAESGTVEDNCCWLIYGNENCEVDPTKSDYETWCGEVKKGQLPFDVGSWMVSNCVAMLKG